MVAGNGAIIHKSFKEGETVVLVLCLRIWTEANDNSARVGFRHTDGEDFRRMTSPVLNFRLHHVAGVEQVACSLVEVDLLVPVAIHVCDHAARGLSQVLEAARTPGGRDARICMLDGCGGPIFSVHDLARLEGEAATSKCHLRGSVPRETASPRAPEAPRPQRPHSR